VENSPSKFEENKKVNDQTDAKYAHHQKMAEIALKGKEVTLA
jgi:hypothetical protein